MRGKKMAGAVIAAIAGVLVLSGCSSTESSTESSGSASQAVDRCEEVRDEVLRMQANINRWSKDVERMMAEPRATKDLGNPKIGGRLDKLIEKVNNEVLVGNYMVVDNEDCFSAREVAQAQANLDEMRSY